MSIASLPLILEPDQLQDVLQDEDLLLVDLCQGSVYRQLHVPGAIHVNPVELVSGVPPATGSLPGRRQLSALFSRLGLRSDQFVVAYDDEGGGWAGRFLWTLDVVGHSHHAYLNGGIHAWLNGGFPVQADPVEAQPGEFEAVIDHSVVADLDEIMEQLGSDDLVIWDARSAEEYHGLRRGALRNGHIPGAINLDWVELMDHGNSLRLLPPDRLRELLIERGITPDKRVITHCQSHHRSGLSYLAGKSLGYAIKAYPGSWSEWGNHPDTPIEN